MTCSTCKFWKARTDGVWGSCRRFPPGGDGMWPGVSSESWCGEHKYATGALVPTGVTQLGSTVLSVVAPNLAPINLPPAKGKKP